MSILINFVDSFSIRARNDFVYDTAVISNEDLIQRLAKLGLKQPKVWLSKQTGYKENSIRQYLVPNGKGSAKFKKDVINAIEQEEHRQKLDKPDSPPWNMIFLTEDEFNRADRASRIVNAESFKDFCRNAILERADELLARKARSTYREIKVVPSTKVAEEKRDGP